MGPQPAKTFGQSSQSAPTQPRSALAYTAVRPGSSSQRSPGAVRAAVDLLEPAPSHAVRPYSKEQKEALLRSLPPSRLGPAPASALATIRALVPPPQGAELSPKSALESVVPAERPLMSVGQLMGFVIDRERSPLLPGYQVALRSGLPLSPMQVGAVWALLDYPALMRSRWAEARARNYVDETTFALVDRLLEQFLLDAPHAGEPSAQGPLVLRPEIFLIMLRAIDETVACALINSPALLLFNNGSATMLL